MREMSSDGIGAELARQIGHGLNNVHAALLEQQRASARDRSATLTKIDALSDKMEARFADLEVKIVDVCDRGGREHKSFDDRLDAVERRMDIQEAHRAGRDQTRKVFADATTWTLEHGWKLALVIFVGWQAFSPMLQRATTSATAAAATIDLRGR